LLIKGSGSGSVQIITDPDPESPKTYGSYGFGSNGSRSGTLVSYLELLAKETITVWKGLMDSLDYRVNKKIQCSVKI
jgi:hypothetical protein